MQMRCRSTSGCVCMARLCSLSVCLAINFGSPHRSWWLTWFLLQITLATTNSYVRQIEKTFGGARLLWFPELCQHINYFFSVNQPVLSLHHVHSFPWISVRLLTLVDTPHCSRRPHSSACLTKLAYWFLSKHMHLSRQYLPVSLSEGLDVGSASLRIYECSRHERCHSRQ